MEEQLEAEELVEKQKLKEQLVVENLELCKRWQNLFSHREFTQDDFKGIEEEFQKYCKKKESVPISPNEVQDLSPLLEQEKKNFQKILLQYLAILPIVSRAKDVIFMEVNVLEFLLDRRLEVYGKFFTGVIVDCLEWHFENDEVFFNRYMEQDKVVSNDSILSVFKSAFVLHGNMRYNFLKLFVDVLGNLNIDKISLLMLFIHEDFSYGPYALEKSMIFSVIDFVKVLLLMINAVQGKEILETCDQDVCDGLIIFFLNKLSDVSLNISVQIDVCRLTKRLVKSHLFDVNDIINMFHILISRIKSFVSEDGPALKRSHVFSMKELSAGVENTGDIHGYNDEFVSPSWNYDRLSNGYKEYYEFIDEIVTFFQVITHKFYASFDEVNINPYSFGINQVKIFSEFLSFVVKAISVFPANRYFCESSSKQPCSRNVAKVFCRFPCNTLQQVIYLSMHDLVQGLEKSEEIKLFFLTLLQTPTFISTATIAAVFDYYLKNVTTIANCQHCSLQLLEMVYFVVFENMENKVPENKEVVVIYLAKIISKIIEKMRCAEASEFKEYLRLVHKFLLSNERHHTEIIKSLDEDIIVYIFERFLEYLEYLTLNLKEIILDFCLEILLSNGFESRINSKKFLVLNLKVIQYSLVYNVNGSLKLISKGIEDKNLFELLSRCKGSLYNILLSPSKTLKARVFLLLAKLNNKGQENPLDYQQLNYKPDAEHKLKIHVGEIENSDESIFLQIPMDESVKVASEILNQRKTHSSNSLYSWFIIKTFLLKGIDLNILTFIQKLVQEKSFEFAGAYKFPLVVSPIQIEINSPIHPSALCALFAQVTYHKSEMKESATLLWNLMAYYTWVAVILEWESFQRYHLYIKNHSLNPLVILDAFLQFVSTDHDDCYQKAKIGKKF